MSTQSSVTVTGVDMGSSTVKIAAVVKGGVDVIVNQANLRQTPNVVGLGQKERLIGELGKLKIKSNQANTVLAPNRLLGFASQCPYTNSQMLFTPAKLQKPNQQIAFSLLSNKAQQTFVPQQLVAAFITEMQTTISQTNKLQNKNMVIAIPGYLTKHQRKAMLDAIQIARKGVQNDYPTQLVSEEVAVSMEYGYNRRAEFDEELQNAKNVLFIDLGHSKCNIYLTAFNKQYFRVLTSAFDRQLGCKYMDWELLKFCAAEFDSKNPNLPIQLMQSKKAIQKLLQRIEKQRKILSGIKEVQINAQCLLEGEDFNYTMKRQKFETICSPVIQKFKSLLEKFVNSLKEKGVKIDSVELVGGGTRIPVILNAITSVIGEQPSRTLNSNQCIAKGAALISAMNSIVFKAQPYNYFQNYEYNVGLKINGVKYNKRLIERNQILTEKQKIVQIQVEPDVEKLVLLAEYEEGEIEEGLERKIFEVEIDVKEKKKRKGSKGKKQEDKMEEQEGNKELSKVSLHLTLDPVSKLLQFHNATSPTLLLQTKHYSDFQHLTQHQIHTMQTREKQLTMRDLKIKRFYHKKNEYESTCYKLREEIESVVSGMGEYVDKGKEQEVRGMIQKEVERMEEMDMDHIDTLEEVNKRQKELKQNVYCFINTITKLKQQYELLNHQLKTLSSLIQSIISTRPQNNYPEQVNQTGEWINQIFQKLQSQPKSIPPPVTPQEVKNMRIQLENGVKHFDQEQERKRTKSYRQRTRQQHQQQPQYNPTGTFFRPQHSNYNPFGGRSYYSPYENPNKSNYNPGGFWDRNFF